MLPASLLTLSVGAIYGFWCGTFLVTFFSTFGALANFLTARFLLRGFIGRFLIIKPRFLSFDQAIRREGWKVILFSRFSPVFPHSLISYAAGLTKIPLTQFSLATLLGYVPLSAVYTYAGSIFGTVVRANLELGCFSPMSISISALGLIATLLAVAISARIANRALSNIKQV
ncbi:MAG: VTT domain-containing protein [Chthoniobacterales bacterium]|nr:VTT domain-containing protein [Chthoniobacterales bacterium]